MRLNLLLVIILFSSCTEYKYVTFSGENIQKTPKNEFLFQNDSVEVLYHFESDKGNLENGNGNIGIRIFNKTPQLMEVEWKKSAIIINNQSFSYYNPKQAITGSFEADSLILNCRTRGDLKATVFVNKESDFIPPSTFIYKQPFDLTSSQVMVPSVAGKKQLLEVENMYKIGYKRKMYTKEETPFTFRSFLVVKGADGRERILEHTFWVSEVLVTDNEPGFLPSEWRNRGDRLNLKP